MAFSSSARSDPRDLLSKPSVSFLVFWLPAIAIVATGSSHFSATVRTIVWPAALITMGAACTVNATRCGRLHCYFTGPFFFLMAAVTLFYGFGVLRLGGNGWNLIGLTLLGGTVAFCCVPELLSGRYWLHGD
jgi:hypothetical protein